MARQAPTDLNALLVFAAVADCGSFTAAAEQLGTTKARASLVVRRLETQLGSTLLARTTRRVGLTNAGQLLYRRCVPALRDVRDALLQLDEPAELRGSLRIAAAPAYGEVVAMPIIAAFSRLHPALDIELRISEKMADMLKEGIDVALRGGWLRDSSLRATPIGEFNQYVVTSPGYLERAGAIRHPRDLAGHPWIALSLLSAPLTWRFTSARGQKSTVRMESRLRTDSTGTLCRLLEEGAGISTLDSFTCAKALREGTLVKVLPQWSLPAGGMWAVYPPGRHPPAKARAFVEFYRQWLASGGQATTLAA